MWDWISDCGWNVNIMTYYDAIVLSCVVYDDVWESVLSEDWVGRIVFTDCEMGKLSRANSYP